VLELVEADLPVMVVAIADLAATAFHGYRYDAMSGWALLRTWGVGALILPA
jgi:hypothetical protein